MTKKIIIPTSIVILIVLVALAVWYPKAKKKSDLRQTQKTLVSQKMLLVQNRIYWLQLSKLKPTDPNYTQDLSDTLQKISDSLPGITDPKATEIISLQQTVLGDIKKSLSGLDSDISIHTKLQQLLTTTPVLDMLTQLTNLINIYIYNIEHLRA